MKKKLAVLAFASLLSLNSAVYAAIPDNSIIIGKKAFDVSLLFKNEYTGEIQDALDEASREGLKSYYNLGDEPGFKGLFTGSLVPEEELKQLPKITYKNAQGIPTEYGEGNGVPVEESQYLEVLGIE